MADDANLVWRGPFASLPRPMDAGMVRDAATAASVFAGLAALALVPYLIGWIDLAGANRAGLTGVFAGAVATSVAQFVLCSASPQQMELLHPTVSVSIFFLGSVLMATAVVFAGPTSGSVAVFYVEFMLLAFVLLRVKWASAVTVFLLATYAIALAALDAPPAPAQQFINVLASATAAGALIGGMASRLDRARHALADLNHNLEDRVAEQVDELERTGRLKRFLSPQVAHVITSDDAETVSAPHRRDVAVFFVDLRGFSAYTNVVSADDVVRVLTEFYEVVGAILQEHGATVGGLDGDGIMAYIGDPIERDDSAEASMAMACAVAERLDAVVGGWAVDGRTLGYGIGLAFGPATLGVMGFEGLYDYAAVGAVVNLAARLCAEAKHREIVVDASFKSASGFDVATERRSDVDLKGFGLTETFLVRH